MEIEESRRAAAGSMNARGRSLSELEDIRRRFKGARFDSPYSEFGAADVIALMIADFLTGAINRDDLWRRIERAHKTRRRDWDRDLGGDEWRGGFGLPDNWGAPGPFGGPMRPPRRPGGVRTPRPPRLPRGFGTGGGFGGGRSGGGGFKTGGGF